MAGTSGRPTSSSGTADTTEFITRSGAYDTWIGVADYPVGPWKNLGEDNTPIVSGGGKAGRIVAAYNMDAQPFIDDDGQAYMYWGWSEAMAARLTPDLKNLDGEVHFPIGTKWLPKGGELPQWLAVDWGESKRVTRIRTSPEFRDVPYGYRIELSEDSQTWQTVTVIELALDQPVPRGQQVGSVRSRFEDEAAYGRLVIENRPGEHRTDGLRLSVSEDGRQWTEVWAAPQRQEAWEVPVTTTPGGGRSSRPIGPLPQAGNPDGQTRADLAPARRFSVSVGRGRASTPRSRRPAAMRTVGSR